LPKQIIPTNNKGVVFSVLQNSNNICSHGCHLGLPFIVHILTKRVRHALTQRLPSERNWQGMLGLINALVAIAVRIAPVLAARARDAIAPFGMVAVVAGSVPATSLCIHAAVAIGIWSVGTMARMRCAHLLAEVALQNEMATWSSVTRILPLSATFLAEGERTERIGILVLKL
jgi:hypothetical protein